MDLARIARHLLMTPGRLRKALPQRALAAIETAIAESEGQHAGQIRFAAEGALEAMPLFRGQSARERAIEVFAQLKVWDTEHNNGVLIYLLLADRDVEIVVDRGIAARIGDEQWARVCRDMEAAFRQGDYARAVIGGILAVTRHLASRFPAAGAHRNELPDEPAVPRGGGLRP